jgi:hypothetical protein
MSTAARTFLLIFGVLYLGWTFWLISVWRRTLFYPTDSKLSTSARRYRMRLYAFWTSRLYLGCFFLTFASLAPLSKETMILLALPVALLYVLSLLAILMWRNDYRVLREAGLLKY